ncbi:MAG: helix-turn-helix domain-containing protein [Acidimicrobiia bacterium]
MVADSEIDLRREAARDQVLDVPRAAWISTTQDVLGLVCRKWVVAIVRCLLDGPRRHFQLECEISGVQPKVLRETLRSLERDGLVERILSDDDHGGKCIAYQLTDLGMSLTMLLTSVFDWGVENLVEVRAQRPT